ncbi:SVM family protein ['Elaeagnus angustifolia' witches'-broom phytoplasma]|uniref:SVM family protein n=1 Tax='Elaeagnus angustifolia' witches'-broom phytoplasma TaxID=1538355 RepID=A0ABS5VAN8_9MOLU|nr:SVM family protein ['Elaeagnus angustifolia' witches'-broom phytoplasma]MCX2955838.1 SVM family protein [Candidatus Phytoplasma australiense]
MFKLQNQFKIISICLFVFLGLLFMINNNQVMAMENNNSLDLRSSEHLSIINDKIWSLSVKKQEIFILSVSCEDQRTKSILEKRYFRYIKMIKNLEQQRKSILDRGYYNNPILYQLINDFNQQLFQLNRNL